MQLGMRRRQGDWRRREKGRLEPRRNGQRKRREKRTGLKRSGFAGKIGRRLREEGGRVAVVAGLRVGFTGPAKGLVAVGKA